MVDQLITVDSDAGPIEPEPVTIFFNGQAVDFSSLLGGTTSITRLPYKLPASAAGLNPLVIKSSPGYGFFVHGYNNNAAARYLKFYNKATAPTVGTDIPILTFYLAPSDTFSLDLSSVRFTAGIGMGLTTGSPDNDTGAVTAGDIMGLNIIYG